MTPSVLRHPCIRCAEPLLTMNERWPRCVDVSACTSRAADRVARLGLFGSIPVNTYTRPDLRIVEEA